MKKHLFFAACLATALFSACNNNEVEQLTSNEGTKVSFAINRDVARATIDAADGKLTLAANDKVGVISTGLTTNIENALFTVTAEGRLTPPEETSYTFDQTASFYAYFPSSDADVTVNNNTAVEFTVKSDQSAEGNYLASDFITASATDQAPTNEAIQLTFGHRLTLVKVALTGFDSPTSVTLNQVKPTATWTISDNKIAVSGSATDITMWNNTTASEYWAIVPAQTIAQNAVMFTIEDNGKHYTYAPDSDIELTANSPKKFTLTLRPDTKTVALSTELESSWGTEAEKVTADVEKMNYVTAPTSLMQLTSTTELATANSPWGYYISSSETYPNHSFQFNENSQEISIIQSSSTVAHRLNCTLFYFSGSKKINTSKKYQLTFNMTSSDWDSDKKGQIIIGLSKSLSTTQFYCIEDAGKYYPMRIKTSNTQNTKEPFTIIFDCSRSTSQANASDVTEANITVATESTDTSFYLFFYSNKQGTYQLSDIKMIEID